MNEKVSEDHVSAFFKLSTVEKQKYSIRKEIVELYMRCRYHQVIRMWCP